MRGERSFTVEVTADGEGLVSHAGTALLAQVAERLRLPRATQLQELSRLNKTRFHLPDGPLQEERDREMATRGDRSIAAVTWLYAHDAAAIDTTA